MLNDKQEQIFVGSMLGDGCISKNFSNEGLCRFEKGQSKKDFVGEDKLSYMNWMKQEFDEFSTSVIESSIKSSGIVKEISGDKTYDRYNFYTKSLKLWEILEAEWYVLRTDHKWYKRTKIVPRDIKLTPLTLCVWHMDDGSVNPKDANIELNTQGFSVEEVDFLIERINKDLSIKSHKKKGRKKSQYKIYIGRDHYFDFMEMIKPHIEWDCFKYKVDTETYDKKPHQGETHSLSKLTKKNIKQIFKLRDKGWLQKKIANNLGISQANVSVILSGDRWSHLGTKRDVIRKPRLTKEMKSQIVLLKEDGVFQKAIAERLNINQSTVSRVLKENHCHVLN